ncbi:MAG: class I SAM-dependent methyltransferase [Pelobium sp.]
MLCPLCNSTNTKSFLKQTNYEIIKCSNCKNGFTSPPPVELNYEHMDFHANEIIAHEIPLRGYPELVKTHQKTYDLNIKLIKKHLPNKKSKILEIGSGEGILAEMILKSGYDITCIEPSLTASKRAIKRGLKCVQGFFPNSIIIDTKFDMVIMTQVLEHIEQPLKLLKNIYKQLEKGGLILLNQTNFESLIVKIQKENWYAWLPKQHYWHFTPKGIKEISANLGFKVVDCQYSNLVSLGRKEKLIRDLAIFFPKNQDQFHVLLQKQ